MTTEALVYWRWHVSVLRESAIPPFERGHGSIGPAACNLCRGVCKAKPSVDRRLRDHVKTPIITSMELDKIRARFIAGTLRPQAYSFRNDTVAGLIVRLEAVEENNQVLKECLDDVEKNLDAARKEI